MLMKLQSRAAWLTLAIIAAFFLVVIPVLKLLTPADSFLHAPDYLIVLIGKFFCYAIVAIAIDLIWGFTGILSLGHGVFFALGGYCMGMYLMRASAGLGVYKSELPDFMVFLDWKEYPWFWHGFQYFGYAMLMVVLVPALLAYLFGFFAFRSRIKGVYFSIITQAMTFAFVLLFFRNETGFGGNNGLTDFKNLLGFELKNPDTKLALYCASGLFLIGAYLFALFVVKSKFGRVLMAIRDAESRLRFSGYDTLQYKLWIWTASAAMCGIAGALYVPQVGIINPSEMQPANSIEMAIWVAVGGRGSLVGAVLGSTVINTARSWFTVAYPDAWLYVLGILFISVTLFMPNGLVGLGKKLFAGRKKA